MVNASTEYLDAVEHFVRWTLNVAPMLVVDPETWMKTANVRLVARLLAAAILKASGKSAESRTQSDEPVDLLAIESRLYAAASRIRLLAPREVLDVMNEIEDFVRRWQKTPRFEVAREWPERLRPKVIETLQKAVRAEPL